MMGHDSTEGQGDLSRRSFLKRGGAGLAAFATGIGPARAGSRSPAPRDRQRPNVLVILIDQLRYDVFSHRGDRMIETPNIDRLAAGGALFTDATCSSPVCGPSRAALLSGCISLDGEVYVKRNREMEQPGVWNQDVTTVDEALCEAGYHVEYHGKWHVGRGHRACYQGEGEMFDHTITAYTRYLEERYERPKAGGAYKVEKYLDWPYRYWPIDDLIGKGLGRTDYQIMHSHPVGVLEIGDEDTLTAWTTKKTLRFLREAPPEPFSVTCSILHPHGPLLASETYASLFDPAFMPMPPNVYGSYAPQNPRGRKPPIPEAIPTGEEGLGQFAALYYALVKEVDDWVGRLLDALEEEGLAEDTLVVFTADHGELMGSHNALGKGQFFEEALRVPLIMRYPGHIEAGFSTDAPASGIDVAPTILDYCGIAPLPQFHGRSLRTNIEGQAPDDPFAFAEYREARGQQKCLRSTDWKYVRRPGAQNLLFDLRHDPYEMHNLLEDDHLFAAAREVVDYAEARLSQPNPTLTPGP